MIKFNQEGTWLQHRGLANQKKWKGKKNEEKKRKKKRRKEKGENNLKKTKAIDVKTPH